MSRASVTRQVTAAPPRMSMLLFGVLLVAAAALRLVALSAAPPALLPDEASNGYDAYCLLETGKDRWGAFLPLHLEAFGRGDYRPALYAYLTVPFVGLLGPEHLDLAVRLPAAIWGVATIACFYALIARVGDRRTALWAALFLALSPWHLRISRFGHESALTPGFLIVALLLLSKAGWPLHGPCGPSVGTPRLRALWMVAFGLVVGLSLYSYASMRLFMPVMLVAGALIYRDAWFRFLKGGLSSPGNPSPNLWALLAGFAAFLLVVTPLLCATYTHWDQVSGRARYASWFHQGLPWTETLWRVGRQYLAHFGPRWLLTQGDRSALSPLPGVGQVNWCLLPLLPIGLIHAWRQRRANQAYAVALAWLLLYPLPSALCPDAPHGNRAACGIGVFEWIAAIGISALLGRWPGRPGRNRVLSGVLLASSLLHATWVVHRYWTTTRQPFMAHLLQTDLREAVIFLRTRWTDYDRIFISEHTSNEQQWANLHPYIYVLTYLPVAPAQFHAWEKTVGYRPPDNGFHYVESAGPFTFSARPELLEAQFRSHPHQRVLIVGRHGDVTGGRLLHVIRDVRDEVRFELIEIVPP
jgi:4-amino-4-deoxy-L-arabinose transferase-like glycosyltransferase